MQNQFSHSYIALVIAVNCAAIVVPNRVTAAIHTTAINATKRPYSTKLAPSSSRRKRAKNFFMSYSTSLKELEARQASLLLNSYNMPMACQSRSHRRCSPCFHGGSTKIQGISQNEKSIQSEMVASHLQSVNPNV